MITILCHSNNSLNKMLLLPLRICTQGGGWGVELLSESAGLAIPVAIYNIVTTGALHSACTVSTVLAL